MIFPWGSLKAPLRFPLAASQTCKKDLSCAPLKRRGCAQRFKRGVCAQGSAQRFKLGVCAQSCVQGCMQDVPNICQTLALFPLASQFSLRSVGQFSLWTPNLVHVLLPTFPSNPTSHTFCWRLFQVTQLSKRSYFPRLLIWLLTLKPSLKFARAASLVQVWYKIC